MIMEFSIGRAGERDIAGAFRRLEPKGSKWHIVGYFQVLGCVMLLMFYTIIAGWCLSYFYFMAAGKLQGLNAEQIAVFFGNVLASPQTLILWMGITIFIGALICIIGLQAGVERVSKIMMLSILFILVILIFRAVTLPNASEGLKFYLLPDFNKMFGGGLKGFASITYAAIGQAFFTLSLGIWCMTIFGSYINKEYSLTGESILVIGLDTLIALMAGLVIFPTTFSFGINPGQGAALVFLTLPNIFNSMMLGRLWGSLFFLFLSMAALTTVIAVLENIVSFNMAEFNMKREESVILWAVILFILGIPIALGFNVLSFIEPMGKGTGLLDLFDFIVSNNMLPLGGIAILIFCTRKYGWGYDNFIKEANLGKGAKFPSGVKFYVSYVLPLIILFIFIVDFLHKTIIK